MEIKPLILKKIKTQGEVNVADIVKATGFSRAYVHRFFQELRDEGKIILLGRANKARYLLAQKELVARVKRKILDFHCILENKNIAEDIVLDKIKKGTGIFFGLSQKIVQILNYGFTEMLNNAIEHSKSRVIEVSVKKEKTMVRFDVVDRGIGIFNNIRKKKRLKNELEAIQDLIKGKQTTMPQEHSGEGIFFTSKAGDMLLIQSSNKKLIFNNILNDIFIKNIKNLKGTKVTFTIGLKSKKDLNALFQQYCEDSFKFNKTEVRVVLYKADSDYISRSQARRILSGLEKFKTIILDFHNLDTIGQSFADEVFRVWKNRHLHIDIQWKNSNDNIDFMIKRALPK
ncbi:MAG: DUF4325 domain-containing protein [Candidatus Nealsonbacteria bacterium]|nr:DUF4325 domain-containing protein [Candidatus Nealsonbacteria bacterium]